MRRRSKFTFTQAPVDFPKDGRVQATEHGLLVKTGEPLPPSIATAGVYVLFVSGTVAALAQSAGWTVLQQPVLVGLLTAVPLVLGWMAATIRRRTVRVTRLGVSVLGRLHMPQRVLLTGRPGDGLSVRAEHIVLFQVDPTQGAWSYATTLALARQLAGILGRPLDVLADAEEWARYVDRTQNARNGSPHLFPGEPDVGTLRSLPPRPPRDLRWTHEGFEALGLRLSAFHLHVHDDDLPLADIEQVRLRFLGPSKRPHVALHVEVAGHAGTLLVRVATPLEVSELAWVAEKVQERLAVLPEAGDARDVPEGLRRLRE